MNYFVKKSKFACLCYLNNYNDNSMFLHTNRIIVHFSPVSVIIMILLLALLADLACNAVGLDLIIIIIKFL